MASNTDTGPRSADIEFLFEALNYVTAPLTINVALLGEAKGAKANTLAKRISTIAKRYNLSITSTTKGEVNAPATPGKPKAVITKPSAGKTPGSRKRKTPDKVKKESDGEDDEVEVNGKKSDEEAEHGGKKAKASNGDMGIEDEDAHADVAGEDVVVEKLA